MSPRSKGKDPVDGPPLYFKVHYGPQQMRAVTYGAVPLME